MRVANILSVCCVLTCIGFSGSALAQNDQAKSRAFSFRYAATIIDVPAGAEVKVWFPIATSNHQQDVSIENLVAPGAMQINTEQKYGNKIGYFNYVADQQDKELSVEYIVKRRESELAPPVDLPEDQRMTFTAANTLVPISGKTMRLLQGKTLAKQPMDVGRQLYEIVEQHMKYDKSIPGYGNGDSDWACDSQTGNCTDFHSLFISLARGRRLPARFEIGFPLPPGESSGSIAGYHCWAWFHIRQKGWVPVDISEADKHPELKQYYFGHLTADRIAFSSGRDIELIPKSMADPLNYFVYPHIEVDGEVWPQDRINLDFSFQQIKQARQ